MYEEDCPIVALLEWVASLPGKAWRLTKAGVRRPPRKTWEISSFPDEVPSISHRRQEDGAV